MISDFNERRIPKRKDRFNLIILLYIFLVTLPLWIIFVPGLPNWSSEYLSILFIIFFLVVATGSSAYSWWHWRKKWEATANLLNLNLETYKPHSLSFFGWPRISGLLRGNQVKIERFTRGAGRNKRVYTSITLNLPEALKEQIAISGRGLIAGLGDRFRSQNQDLAEVNTGYDDLDRNLLVKASSDYFVKSILSSHAIRQGLLELKPQARELRITLALRQLSFHERSSITDPDYLAAVTNLLLDIADYARRYG